MRIALSLLLLPALAIAQRGAPERSERRGYAQGGIGGAVMIDPRVTGGLLTHIEVGAHPLGDAEGLVVGLGLNAAFGGYFVDRNGDPSWLGSAFVRAGYDLTVIRDRDFVFQVGPFVALGAALGGPMARAPLTGGFDAHWGADLRLLLVDRALVLYARIADVEVITGPSPGALIAIDPSLGAGANFD